MVTRGTRIMTQVQVLVKGRQINLIKKDEYKDISKL